MHRTAMAAFAAAACSLALPAASGAAVKTVFTGPAGKPPAGVPKDAGINAFAPRSVKLHAGDTLTFQITGCPAVVVNRPGQAPPFVVEDDTHTISGVKDPGGAAMWFEGQAQPIANPSVFFGVKSGKAFTGKPLASGFPGGPGAPKPWSVRFPKAGTYEMSCPLFPRMTGTIEVVGRGTPVPGAKADRRRAAAQVAAAAKTLKALAKQAPPEGDVVTAGPDAPTGEVLYRFTPKRKTVAVGAPVTLKMGDGSHEIHTFTFYTDKAAIKKLARNSLAPLPGTGKNGPPVMGIDPLAGLRSDPAGAPLTDDGTTHGNGFVNTGLLDADPTSAWPDHDTITFTKPGTYTYICALHPEMAGTIVAQ